MNAAKHSPIHLKLPGAFHYEHTLYSHGWCALLPFSLDTSTNVLRRTIALPRRRTAVLTFEPLRGNSMRCGIEHGTALSEADLDAAHRSIRTMFQLDQKLDAFYRRISTDTQFGWMARLKTGRMLRGLTFFEDVIKMVLTTNCAWSLTESMTERLVRRFGAPAGNDSPAFPTAEAIAAASEAELRSEVRLGYRAPYVLALSKRAASGATNIEAFRTSDAAAGELYKELLRLEGVGPYAAGNLLKLLGRFDYLGLDSWCRAAFSKLHGNGADVSDGDIERFYAPYEEWKGLVMWLDVTQHWYAKKFPFLAAT
jgi:3-methyladenine DNA glycosylase/8-oxoguanine DNA glycosylase